MAQNMSDSQVLEYVKEGIRQGKEQKQLASELARKGVTKEQAMRVKQLYEQQNNVNASNATGTDAMNQRLREEMKESTSDMLEAHPSTQDIARSNQVFGRNIFNTRNLTFEPSVNIATPFKLSSRSRWWSDYRYLGSQPEHYPPTDFSWWHD